MSHQDDSAQMSDEGKMAYRMEGNVVLDIGERKVIARDMPMRLSSRGPPVGRLFVAYRYCLDQNPSSSCFVHRAFFLLMEYLKSPKVAPRATLDSSDERGACNSSFDSQPPARSPWLPTCFLRVRSICTLPLLLAIHDDRVSASDSVCAQFRPRHRKTLSPGPLTWNKRNVYLIIDFFIINITSIAPLDSLNRACEDVRGVVGDIE